MLGYQVVSVLKKYDGAIEYDSDYCTQVLLPLGDGKYLRVCSAGEEGDVPLSCDIAVIDNDSPFGFLFEDIK